MIRPVLHLFGGPNGAGKTTFARPYLTGLPDQPRFLNADEMARGLSPFNPASVAQKAGKLLLAEIGGCIEARRSFGLESTLSGRSQIGIIRRAKDCGYQVEINYLWLPSPELSIRRIAQRVLKGGHHVPDGDVIRRYKRSFDNIVKLYAPLADVWVVWDNTVSRPALVLESPLASSDQLKACLESTESPDPRTDHDEMPSPDALTPGPRGLIAAQSMARTLVDEQKRWGLPLLSWKDGRVVGTKP